MPIDEAAPRRPLDLPGDFELPALELTFGSSRQQSPAIGSSRQEQENRLTTRQAWCRGTLMQPGGR